MARMENTQLCLDTNALIDYLKAREPGASAVEKAVKEYNCCVTSITVYELLFGVARAKREIGEQALLGVMTILPFDNAVAKRAATLHAELISQNQDIGIKEVNDEVWLVTFMDYDLGFFDLENQKLEPLEYPFAPEMV